MSAPEFKKNMAEFIDLVERLAFDIPAPNEHTPKLVQAAVEARHSLRLYERDQKQRYRQLMRNMSKQQ